MKVPVRSTIAGLAILLAGGCAARTPPPLETPPPAVAPPPVVSPAERDYIEGQALLEEGKYDGALELFAAVWNKMPGHPGVEKNFPVALEGIKNSGDEARRQGRPEEAGKQWTAAMRFLSHPAMKGRSPSFTKADLKGRIDKLSENLMEKGLADYREGRLEAAIATWRQILAYDPAHEEAAKSVKTATTQLENLKKLTPPADGK